MANIYYDRALQVKITKERSKKLHNIHLYSGVYLHIFSSAIDSQAREPDLRVCHYPAGLGSRTHFFVSLVSGNYIYATSSSSNLRINRRGQS